MIYCSRDLYKEWESLENKNISYGEYVRQESKKLSDGILQKYSFLKKMGYAEQKNSSEQIVFFTKRKGNIEFELFQLSLLTLYVYYDDLSLKIRFNGDSEYEDRIAIDTELKAEITEELIWMEEQKLIKQFNNDVPKLLIRMD